MTDSESEKINSHLVYRILDAAINRAGEGIRVVEDYVRMVLEDGFLSRQLKSLRHELTEAVESVDTQLRMAARDTIGDVGCKIETESEYKREAFEFTDLTPKPGSDLLRANMSRTQQALRTIEEYSKTIDPEVAKNVEQLRYRSYTIEKAVFRTIRSIQSYGFAVLYVLIDGCGIESGDQSRLVELTEQLIEAGVDLIQLRDKKLTDVQLVTAGRVIAKLTSETETHFIMNDRADLAVASGADGVHLGQDDLAVADARRIMGPSRIIGVSIHTLEQACQAVLDGADYIGVGPVFSSTTKSFDSHVGLTLVSEISEERVSIPAFAIGGIDSSNLEHIIDAGLDRIAVSGAVVNAPDPGKAAAELKQMLSSENQ